MEQENKYPQELIPKLEYKQKIGLTTANVEKLVVVRRTSIQPKYSEIGGARRIQESCIEGKHIFNYSMNLLGGGFDVEKHLRYNAKCDDWDGFTIYKDEDLTGKWTYISEPCYAIYYRASDLHGIKFPYMRNFNSQTDYSDYCERVGKIADTISWKGKDASVGVSGYITIDHQPTMMNYWHVTLNVHEENETQPWLEPGKGAWKKKINLAIKEYLVTKSSSPDEVEVFPLPDNLYVKV